MTPVPRTLDEAAKQVREKMKKAEADTKLQHYDQKLLGIEKQLKEAAERWDETQQLILAAKVELEAQMAEMWGHLADMQRELDSYFEHQRAWERPARSLPGEEGREAEGELLPENKE